MRSQHCSVSTRQSSRPTRTPTDTLAAIKEGAAKQLVLDGEGDRRSVQIGEKLWPLPFPIVKGEDGKWAFDTYAGLEEIVNRRVGENELQAIETMRAYVDAQEDYASAGPRRGRRGGIRAEARQQRRHDRRALLADRRRQWRKPGRATSTRPNSTTPPKAKAISAISSRS